MGLDQNQQHLGSRWGKHSLDLLPERTLRLGECIAAAAYSYFHFNEIDHVHLFFLIMVSDYNRRLISALRNAVGLDE